MAALPHLYTTHVGSFPLEYSEDNVTRVFRDIVDIGLDYPCVPQLRNFIHMFLEPCIGTSLKLHKGTFIILDRKLCDPRPPVEWVLVRKVSATVSKVRVSVTGPFTLASYIFPREMPSANLMLSVLRDKKFVLEELAEYVRKLVKAACEAGFGFVCVDEPVLSVVVGARKILFGYDAAEITQVLDTVFEGCGAEYRAVHVCSRVSKLLAKVLLESSKVNVLDHEFQDSPGNESVYSFEELDAHGKFLAAGVVSSKKPEVEDVVSVEKRVRELLKMFSYRLRFIKPDCGFRGLRGTLGDPEKEYRVSLDKLRVLVEVRRRVAGEEVQS